MASFSITNLEAISFGAYVTGLDNPAEDYDNFKFRLSQNGTLIFEYNHTSSSSSEGFSIIFSNENWLGYNYVTPNTDYSLTIIARYNGTDYSLGTEFFTTESVSPPSGTITPSVYTKIKSQGVVGNCVAMSLSTAMDRFRAERVGTDYENYSISYIFGSDGRTQDDMIFIEGVENCKAYGSPRWDLVSTSFYNDNKSKSESVSTFNNADNYALSNALLQKFTGYTNIDFYDCYSVSNAIQNYGCFMLNFRQPNNFYNISSDGIVPQPNSYSGANHSILLIGLTTKNGKPHWIAQNSWGTDWGLNGICYIPWDWGIGVLAPTRGGSNPTSWTLESYSVYNNNVSSFVPSAPTNVTAVKTEGLSAMISWNSSLTGALYTIFASKNGIDEWYIKGRTTNLSLSITFNEASIYKIRVLSVMNNLYSDYSNIAVISMINILPWEWYFPKVSGGNFNITSNEWISFCNKILEIMAVHNLTNTSEYVILQFYLANGYFNTGIKFSAEPFKNISKAINLINGQINAELLNVVSGGNIYAWYFENLKTALNNAI